MSGALLGVAMIVFACRRIFAFSLVALAVVGSSTWCMGRSRNTIVQMAAPDRFRGRVVSLHMLTNRGLGPGGNFLTGGLAAVMGAPAALTVLGLRRWCWSCGEAWRYPPCATSTRRGPEARGPTP